MVKALSNQEILDLITPKSKSPQRNYESVNTTSHDYRPDPLKKTVPGEIQSGDKGDIWMQWIKQGRKGAAELIGRWG